MSNPEENKVLSTWEAVVLVYAGRCYGKAFGEVRTETRKSGAASPEMQKRF